MGSYSLDYTGQPMESRSGRVVCLSRTQWETLRPGERLGCGSFGCAYERPDGKVVKITTDPSDIAALRAAQGHRRVVKLYDAFRLRVEGEPVWAGIVERLYEPTPWIQRLARQARPMRGYLRDGYERSTYKGPRYRLPRMYKQWFHAGLCGQFDPTQSPGERQSRRRCNAFVSDVIRVHEHLGRRGFNFFDVHPGNIGIAARGDWKFLDVGYSSDERKPRVRVLAG